ncbi:hypothetical protein JW805_11005 [Roseomonas aeriglobus]|nr:hypothetical protein [Roseomonas aeriglobus]
MASPRGGSLSPVFRVRPVTMDGAALDLPVRIPLEFPAEALGGSALIPTLP